MALETLEKSLPLAHEVFNFVVDYFEEVETEVREGRMSLTEGIQALLESGDIIEIDRYIGEKQEAMREEFAHYLNSKNKLRGAKRDNRVARQMFETLTGELGLSPSLYPISNIFAKRIMDFFFGEGFFLGSRESGHSFFMDYRTIKHGLNSIKNFEAYPGVDEPEEKLNLLKLCVLLEKCGDYGLGPSDLPAMAHANFEHIALIDFEDFDPFPVACEGLGFIQSVHVLKSSEGCTDPLSMCLVYVTFTVGDFKDSVLFSLSSLTGGLHLWSKERQSLPAPYLFAEAGLTATLYIMTSRVIDALRGLYASGKIVARESVASAEEEVLVQQMESSLELEELLEEDDETEEILVEEVEEKKNSIRGRAKDKDVRINDLKRIARRCGLEVLSKRGKGSHLLVRNPETGQARPLVTGRYKNGVMRAGFARQLLTSLGVDKKTVYRELFGVEI